MISTWELHTQLCESAAKRLQVLEGIIDDENTAPKVRVLAIAVLLNHGAGVPQVQVADYGGLFGTPSKQ